MNWQAHRARGISRWSIARGNTRRMAIVVDGMDVDFRLPKDIKRDAKTTDGSAFVGINAVHSKDICG
jgi:hypothetical protein